MTRGLKSENGRITVKAGGGKGGSGGRARTCDPMINSHLLCQLSYAGIVKIEKISGSS